MDLEKVINACIDGDLNAQTDFYNHFYHSFRIISLKASQNEAISDDVLQDSFLQIFKKLDKFNGRRYDEKDILFWCRRIIINKTIDYYRSESKHKHHYQIDYDYIPYEYDFDDSDTYLEIKGISIDDINKAIEELPEKTKHVFELYMFNNLRHDEIANKLGINIGTSKSNLHNAKKKLIKILT